MCSGVSRERTPKHHVSNDRFPERFANTQQPNEKKEESLEVM
jgi:hypothetical protein